MSYATDTILVRDEPKGDVTDKLRVVGPSPIRSAAAAAEWEGGNSDQYVVEPIGDDGFAAPEIVPLDALNRHYSIEYEPDPLPTHIETEQRRRTVRLQTPEEQFRQTLKQQEAEEHPRQRTRIGDADESA